MDMRTGLWPRSFLCEGCGTRTKATLPKRNERREGLKIKCTKCNSVVYDYDLEEKRRRRRSPD